MGREIRRVPPDWEHPVDDRNGNPIPMYDAAYPEQVRRWKKEYEWWKMGIHPGQRGEYACSEDTEFWEYMMPPNRRHYREPFEEPPTAYQVYETVTEGTPITPVFESREGLHEHLVRHGTDADDPFSEHQAMKFIESAWAPSLVIQNGKPHDVREQQDLKE